MIPIDRLKVVTEYEIVDVYQYIWHINRIYVRNSLSKCFTSQRDIGVRSSYNFCSYALLLNTIDKLDIFCYTVLYVKLLADV